MRIEEISYQEESWGPRVGLSAFMGMVDLIVLGTDWYMMPQTKGTRKT